MSIFSSIYCSVAPNGARTIAWTMNPGVNYPSDGVLQVEYARNGGPWEVLASGLSGVCAYIDRRKLNYNKYLNDCYRVRLSSPTDPSIDYVSEMCPAGRTNEYPYSAEAANALVQIEKEISRSGRPGVLLKKKEWGQRCPDCTDFDKQDGVNEQCPACLGTGILGGYYNGISLQIIADQQTEAQELTPTGVMQSATIAARCIAYPWITLNDVWVEDKTNARYRIRSATPISMFKHIPLVYQLQLMRIPLTNIMHSSEADALVLDKDDVFKYAEVTYTPQAPSTPEPATPTIAPAQPERMLDEDSPAWMKTLLKEKK